ncbi:alpha-1,2-fucosyltransferase [Shewanella psychropiezotolerans]|uniref:Alpha-1,2-fucosyltransferase n=1 Tax=Shewanella psychropiezotolerans TaxID=2593655 RepID=A0ABX5WSA1_9GAMM|nr:alpha-1,2-fucosyltransferase [Shewanella psychropiezotolerans]QDO81998.1 alpha-1,2-fucosyltransferase [Shewanella psychropiezotolerans]
MKIVNVVGGLGNQLFQYAFYIALKQQFNEEVKLDISQFNDYKLHNGYELELVFQLGETYSTKKEVEAIYSKNSTLPQKILRYFQRKIKVEERRKHEFQYKNVLVGLENKNVYFRGYWQSYKYFEAVEETLRNTLKFPPVSETNNLELLNKIKNHNTVSIHVRRGDYVGHSTLGGICTTTYYKNAINLINQKVDKPLFIVFSNDIVWCEEYLSLQDAIFVDWNTEEKSYRDLQLMSSCNHNIIANSSFSWWGAWLNNKPNRIVIAPDKWIQGVEYINDLIPSTWNIVSISN